MKSIEIQIKKPLGYKKFSKDVKTFEKQVESILGEKLKPAEYNIIEVYPYKEIQNKKVINSSQFTLQAIQNA